MLLEAIEEMKVLVRRLANKASVSDNRGDVSTII